MTKKILIADDEDEIRKLITATLEDEGYEIHQASNGSKALDIAKQIKPDLVILDIMMPEKTGYEVCEELRRNPETKDVYVLFLGARGSGIAEKTGKVKGGDAFMTKPFEPDDLLDRVKKILKQQIKADHRITH